MPQQNANVARYAFSALRFPDVFRVVRFEGVEELSVPYRFDVRLVSEQADVDFSRIVGHPAVLTADRDGRPTPLAGVVTRFEQAGRTADYVAYRAVLRPRLWQLALTRQSRVFQHATVEDVVREVLRESGLAAADCTFRLSADYAPREYCVQHNETDLAFVSRLLEFEGIHYFFEHTSDGERLVVADDGRAHAAIDAPSVLPYGEEAGLVEGEHVGRLVCREQMVSGRVVLKDYNYRTPEVDLTVEAVRDADAPGHDYVYGGPYRDVAQGQRLADARAEALECQRRVFEGASDCVALRVGHRFTLADHYRGSLDRDYLVTRVTHRGSQRRALGLAGLDDEAADLGRGMDGRGEASVYANTFACIPASVPFRPSRRTPVPRAPGLLTARVETAGGRYPYVDDQGRYRLKMPFDLSDRTDGTATLPVRLAQPSSGPGHGFHFPNHAGAEMVVAFVGGDPDRPLALGAVPTPGQPSTVTGENRMHNVVRTRAGHELLMDDTQGEGRLRLRTPDGYEVLLDDRDDRLRLVTAEGYEVVLHDDGCYAEVRTPAGRRIRLDDAKETLLLQSSKGHRVEVDDGGNRLTIADADDQHTFAVDVAAGKLIVRTEGAGIDLHAPDGTIDIRAREVRVDASGDATVKAANVEVEAGDVHRTRAARITSEATATHETKGRHVASEAQGRHETRGQTIAVQGASLTDIRGALVKINS